jgi:hypothetical protein
MNDYKHAYDNAKAWLDNIRELYREVETADDDRREAIETEVQEMPLEVAVRSAWATPGYDLTAAEYRILLTTGGPALQITGYLDQHNEPERHELQMQDWGTPWREVWPCELAEMDEARSALAWFVSHFYFGG